MKNKAAFFLLIILALAAALRFWGLNSRGLFSHDEGYYFLGAKTIAAGIEYIKLKLMNTDSLPSICDFLRQNGGDYPVGSKHGFYLLSALNMVFFGMKDYAVLYVSAFFGVLSVWVVYLIAKDAFDRNTALLGAFLLAVSPYHIAYSRSAYSNVTAAFFILCGIYFYLKSVQDTGPWLPIFSGLCLGYAVSCHPSQFWVVVIFFIDFLFYRNMKRLFFMLAGFIAPIFMFQFFSLLGIYMARTAGWKPLKEINILMQPYFSQLAIHVNSTGGAKFDFSQAAFYVKLIARSDSIIIFLLYVSGFSSFCYWLIKDKFDYKKSLIVFIGFFLVVLLTFYNNRAARTILPAMPFILITAASGLFAIINKISSRGRFNHCVGVSLVVIALVLINSWAIASCLKTRSAYQDAVRFIRHSGNLKHFTDTTTLSAVYMPDNYKNVYVPEQVSIDKAKQMVREHGFRYLILSYGRYSVHDSELIDFANKSKIKPVLKIESKPFFLLLSDDTSPDSFRLTQGVDSVEVYDVKDLLKI